MQQPIFVQPCSHMLFFTYLTKHMMMSFFVFTMFCIEKRSLFPPQLKILMLTFIIIIQHWRCKTISLFHQMWRTQIKIEFKLLNHHFHDSSDCEKKTLTRITFFTIFPTLEIGSYSIKVMLRFPSTLLAFTNKPLPVYRALQGMNVVSFIWRVSRSSQSVCVRSLAFPDSTLV